MLHIMKQAVQNGSNPKMKNYTDIDIVYIDIFEPPEIKPPDG